MTAQIEAFKLSLMKRASKLQTQPDSLKKQIKDLQQSIIEEHKSRENEREKMLWLHSAMYSLIHGLTQLMVPRTQMQPSSAADKLFLSPQVNELFLSAISEEQLLRNPLPPT